MINRTAVSTLFTFCPPAPPERIVSTSISSGGIDNFFSKSSITGIASTLAKLVCLFPFALNGDIRTNLCTPFPPLNSHKQICLQFLIVADFFPLHLRLIYQLEMRCIPFSAQRKIHSKQHICPIHRINPPAPALMLKIALSLSYSPDNKL